MTPRSEMDMFLVTADDDSNGTWCSICKTDVINGRHPNHGAHIENAKAKAADDERDRLTTPTARKVTAEGMDTYLTVSSNDTLTHRALRGAPDTLCGKVITDDKSPSKDLDCDICASLAGAGSFVNESVSPLADEFGHHTANYLLPPEAYMEDEVEEVEESDWAREANLRPHLDFDFGPEPARRLEEGPFTAMKKEAANCVSCGKRVHENDWPLDTSNNGLVASDYGMEGPDVPQCFVCNNDYDAYTYGLERAKKKWKPKEITAQSNVTPKQRNVAAGGWGFGWPPGDQCRSCHRKFDDRQLRNGICIECERDPEKGAVYNQDSKDERTKEIEFLRSTASPSYYARDPFWLSAKYPGSCKSCGGSIARGDRAFYYPSSKALYCKKDECGGAASRDFGSARQDEDFINRQAASKAEIDWLVPGIHEFAHNGDVPTLPHEHAGYPNMEDHPTHLEVMHGISPDDLDRMVEKVKGTMGESIFSSSTEPAVQQEKIATNWTRDGVPIENGFEIITTTEAERIPFLDVDRVTISAKHECPDCHTEQWLQTTAACDSCGEMKCTDCMDTIGLASFVGQCKKCSSISTEIVPESVYDSDSYRYLSYTLNTEVEESLFLPTDDN